MKIIISAFLIAMLSACGFTPVYKKGEVNYEFVGCNVVTTNPASDESRAFIGPMFPLQVGDTVYFKQVNDDLTVSPVTTGSPCE